MSEVELMEQLLQQYNDYGHIICPECDCNLEIDAPKCSCGWENELRKQGMV